MTIEKTVITGTLESSDVQIVLSPNPDGVNRIHLDSIVKKEYGKSIIAQLEGLLNEYDLQGVDVKVVDQGALDCVIKARMLTALERAGVKVGPDA